MSDIWRIYLELRGDWWSTFKNKSQFTLPWWIDCLPRLNLFFYWLHRCSYTSEAINRYFVIIIVPGIIIIDINGPSLMTSIATDIIIYDYIGDWIQCDQYVIRKKIDFPCLQSCPRTELIIIFIYMVINNCFTIIIGFVLLQF